MRQNQTKTPNDLIHMIIFLVSLYWSVSTLSLGKFDVNSKLPFYIDSQIITIITIEIFSYLFIIYCCHFKILIDFCLKCEESKLFTAGMNRWGSALHVIWHGLVIEMVNKQNETIMRINWLWDPTITLNETAVCVCVHIHVQSCRNRVHLSWMYSVDIANL